MGRKRFADSKPLWWPESESFSILAGNLSVLFRNPIYLPSLHPINWDANFASSCFPSFAHFSIFCLSQECKCHSFAWIFLPCAHCTVSGSVFLKRSTLPDEIVGWTGSGHSKEVLRELYNGARCSNYVTGVLAVPLCIVISQVDIVSGCKEKPLKIVSNFISKNVWVVVIVPKTVFQAPQLAVLKSSLLKSSLGTLHGISGLGFRIPQFLVWCFCEVVMACMLAISALGNGYMYPSLT